MLKILVVDDQRYNRTLLKHILQENNFFCCEAENGFEALNQIKQDKSISLVLMDVDMPVMGGIEATRLIKQNFATRYIPVVFVTAMDENSVISECLSVGGDDFVPKPVNESALVAKVSAHMRTAGLYNQLQKSNKDLSYHKQLIDREHAIIEHVFCNGMKRFDSHCDNLRFNVSPMSMFNGDILLAAPSTAGGLYVLLGDFTGHGLSAAIGCLPVSDVFYAMTRKQSSIAEMAAEMNRKLGELLPDNMFFCCIILELSAAGDRLSYWSGGMNDLLLMSPGGGILKRIHSQHMPLSILDDHEFDATTDILNVLPGTRLLAYTDGVIEAQNGQGEMFGEDRLDRLMAEPCDNYMERVLDALHGFRPGEQQTDDISILELHCETVVHSVDDAIEIAVETVSPPWRLKFDFGPQDLQKSHVIAWVVRQLENFDALKSHLNTLFTILSELFNNALEHGVLDLDSSIKQEPDGFEAYYSERCQRLQNLRAGRVSLTLNYTAGDQQQLEINCQDSGTGFDFHSTLNKESDHDLLGGRGLALLQSLCRAIEYSDGGRSVTAVYSLD